MIHPHSTMELMSKSTYQSSHNVVYSSKYHLVWCPKYRRQVLRGSVENRLKSAFLMRHVEIDGSVQTLDLDAARAELISSSDGIHKVGAGGHPCDSTTKRQDIGARPDETRSESEKRKSSNRRPPGKRSLVRIRKRRMAKANGTSDSTARPEDGVSALAENQPLPTARVA